MAPANGQHLRREVGSLLAHLDLDRVTVIDRRTVVQWTRPQRVAVAAVHKPDLLRHHRIEQDPYLLVGAHHLLPSRPVLDACPVQHFVAPVKHLVPEAYQAVRPYLHLDGILLDVHEVRQIPVVNPDDLAALQPRLVSLKPRHRPYAPQPHVAPDDRRNRRALGLAHLLKLVEAVPVVAGGAKPPLCDRLAVPAFKPVLRVAHQLVFYDPEGRAVFLESHQSRLELERKFLRQLGRCSHKPLFILHQGRLALVKMLGVAATVAEKMSRAVVQNVVGSLAERLHLEVAATVADEKPRVHLLRENARPANRYQPAHAGDRLYLALDVSADSRRAVFHHIFDTALVEAAHDMVIGEEKTELLLFEVVANAVRPRKAGLHDRAALEAARHIVAGELQRLHDLGAHHYIDVVPDVVVLDLRQNRQARPRRQHRQERPRRRLPAAPR